MRVVLDEREEEGGGSEGIRYALWEFHCVEGSVEVSGSCCVSAPGGKRQWRGGGGRMILAFVVGFRLWLLVFGVWYLVLVVGV